MSSKKREKTPNVRFVSFGAVANDTTSYNENKAVNFKPASSLPIYDGNDSDLSVLAKKLLKKDVTTKLKALNDLVDVLKIKDESTISQFMPFFVYAYSRLYLEDNRSIRQTVNVVIESVLLVEKRVLSPHMKNLVGPWWTLIGDPVLEVAGKAQAVYEKAIPLKKRQQVLEYLFPSIIDHLNKNLGTSPETLCDLTLVSRAEAEEKHERLMVSTINSIGKVISMLTIDQNTKLCECDNISVSSVETSSSPISCYRDVMTDKFWKTYLQHKHSSIRKATYQLIAIIVHYAPHILSITPSLSDNCTERPKSSRIFCSKLLNALVSEKNATNLHVLLESFTIFLNSNSCNGYQFFSNISVENEFVPMLRLLFTEQPLLLMEYLLPIVGSIPIEHVAMLEECSDGSNSKDGLCQLVSLISEYAEQCASSSSGGVDDDDVISRSSDNISSYAGSSTTAVASALQADVCVVELCTLLLLRRKSNSSSTSQSQASCNSSRTHSVINNFIQSAVMIMQAVTLAKSSSMSHYSADWYIIDKRTNGSSSSSDNNDIQRQVEGNHFLYNKLLSYADGNTGRNSSSKEGKNKTNDVVISHGGYNSNSNMSSNSNASLYEAAVKSLSQAILQLHRASVQEMHGVSTDIWAAMLWYPLGQALVDLVSSTNNAGFALLTELMIDSTATTTGITATSVTSSILNSDAQKENNHDNEEDSYSDDGDGSRIITTNSKIESISNTSQYVRDVAAAQLTPTTVKTMLEVLSLLSTVVKAFTAAWNQHTTQSATATTTTVGAGLISECLNKYCKTELNHNQDFLLLSPLIADSSNNNDISSSIRFSVTRAFQLLMNSYLLIALNDVSPCNNLGATLSVDGDIANSLTAEWLKLPLSIITTVSSANQATVQALCRAGCGDDAVMELISSGIADITQFLLNLQNHQQHHRVQITQYLQRMYSFCTSLHCIQGLCVIATAINSSDTKKLVDTNVCWTISAIQWVREQGIKYLDITSRSSSSSQNNAMIGSDNSENSNVTTTAADHTNKHLRLQFLLTFSLSTSPELSEMALCWYQLATYNNNSSSNKADSIASLYLLSLLATSLKYSSEYTSSRTILQLVRQDLLDCGDIDSNSTTSSSSTLLLDQLHKQFFHRIRNREYENKQWRCKDKVNTIARNKQTSENSGHGIYSTGGCSMKTVVMIQYWNDIEKCILPYLPLEIQLTYLKRIADVLNSTLLTALSAATGTTPLQSSSSPSSSSLKPKKWVRHLQGLLALHDVLQKATANCTSLSAVSLITNNILLFDVQFWKQLVAMLLNNSYTNTEYSSNTSILIQYALECLNHLLTASTNVDPTLLLMDCFFASNVNDETPLFFVILLFIQLASKVSYGATAAALSTVVLLQNIHKNVMLATRQYLTNADTTCRKSFYKTVLESSCRYKITPRNNQVVSCDSNQISFVEQSAAYLIDCSCVQIVQQILDLGIVSSVDCNSIEKVEPNLTSLCTPIIANEGRKGADLAGNSIGATYYYIVNKMVDIVGIQHHQQQQKQQIFKLETVPCTVIATHRESGTEPYYSISVPSSQQQKPDNDSTIVGDSSYNAAAASPSKDIQTEWHRLLMNGVSTADLVTVYAKDTYVITEAAEEEEDGHSASYNRSNNGDLFADQKSNVSNDVLFGLVQWLDEQIYNMTAYCKCKLFLDTKEEESTRQQQQQIPFYHVRSLHIFIALFESVTNQFTSIMGCSSGSIDIISKVDYEMIILSRVRGLATMLLSSRPVVLYFTSSAYFTTMTFGTLLLQSILRTQFGTGSGLWLPKVLLGLRENINAMPKAIITTTDNSKNTETAIAAALLSSLMLSLSCLLRIAPQWQLCAASAEQLLPYALAAIPSTDPTLAVNLLSLLQCVWRYRSSSIRLGDINSSSDNNSGKISSEQEEIATARWETEGFDFALYIMLEGIRNSNNMSSGDGDNAINSQFEASTALHYCLLHRSRQSCYALMQPSLVEKLTPQLEKLCCFIPQKSASPCNGSVAVDKIATLRLMACKVLDSWAACKSEDSCSTSGTSTILTPTTSSAAIADLAYAAAIAATDDHAVEEETQELLRDEVVFRGIVGTTCCEEMQRVLLTSSSSSIDDRNVVGQVSSTSQLKMMKTEREENDNDDSAVDNIDSAIGDYDWEYGHDDECTHNSNSNVISKATDQDNVISKNISSSKKSGKKHNDRTSIATLLRGDPLGLVLMWLLALQRIDVHRTNQSWVSRGSCVNYLKRSGLSTRIMLLILHLAGDVSVNNKEELSALLQRVETLAKYTNSNNTNISKRNKSPQCNINNSSTSNSLSSNSLTLQSLKQLAIYALFRTVCTLPAMFRSFWNDDISRVQKARLSVFVEQQVRKSLIRREMNLLTSQTTTTTNAASVPLKWDPKEFSVRGIVASGEVIAALMREDTKIEVCIKLPPSYPLKNVEVSCTSRIGVNEGRWRRWVLQMTQLLAMQDGAVIDAVMLWKSNIEKELDGVEPCPICYCILHNKSLSLPTLACPTCSNKFHTSCLYTWFKSSGKSKCVICQQPFFT